MANEKKYRYPGINFFTKEDADIFCGRKNDAERLLNRIMLNNTVVLHGDSGNGKSSLVQAGLLPLLEINNENLRKQKRVKYLPITIRFDSLVNKSNETDVKKAEEKFLVSEIWQRISENAIFNDNELPFISLKENSFWYISKLFERHDTTLLLILDQFEELQVYSRNQIRYFAQKLSELFVSTMPESIYQEYDTNSLSKAIEIEKTNKNREEYNEQIKFLEQPLRVKILFIVREDKLGTMSLLSGYFPDILKNDYLLLQLDEESARSAISNPAEMQGNFLSPRFKIEKSTEDKIIKIIEDTNNPGFYDPIQLQIVCSSIEREIATKKNLITSNDIPSIHDIIKNFYEKAWSDIKSKYRLSESGLTQIKIQIISRLTEDDKKRNLVIKESFSQISSYEAILADLVNVGLLRKIRSGKDEFYQLCHDRFIEPVSTDKIRINARENQTKELQDKVKTTVIALTFIISGLLLFVFMWQSCENTKEAKIDKIKVTNTALERSGNTTLAYLILRDGYEENNKPKKLEKLLDAYKKDDAYLVGIIPLLDNSPDLYFDDNNNLKFTEIVSDTGAYENIWKSKDYKISRLTKIKKGAIKAEIPSTHQIFFFFKDQDEDSVVIYDENFSEIAKPKLYYRDPLPPSISFSNDGNYLLIGTRLFNFPKRSTPEPVPTFPQLGIRFSTFLSDSKHISVAYSKDTMKVFRIDGTANGEEITFNLVQNFTAWRSGDLTQQADRYFTLIAADKQGQYLFAATPQNNIEIFSLNDTNNIYPTQTLKGHSGPVKCISVSNNGKLLLTGSTDNTAILWSLNPLKIASKLSIGNSDITSVYFSRDDRNLLTCSLDSNIYVWRFGKAKDLYDSLFRFSPFEYAIWNLVEREDGKPTDTTSFAGLYKATLNYAINILISKEYINEDPSTKSLIQNAEKQIQQMFNSIKEKRKSNNNISDRDMQLLEIVIGKLSTKVQKW